MSEAAKTKLKRKKWDIEKTNVEKTFFNNEENVSMMEKLDILCHKESAERSKSQNITHSMNTLSSKNIIWPKLTQNK